MLATMLRRSLMEGRRRKAFAALTVALSAMLVTTLFALSIDVGDKMAREMKSYGSNLRVLPKGESMPLVIDGIDYNPLKNQAFLSESDLAKIKDIFWRNNIIGLAPRLDVPVTVKAASGVVLKINLTGTYFNQVLSLPDDADYRTGVKATNPFWKVDGVWPEDDSLDTVLVGQALAKRMQIVQGDRISIGFGSGDILVAVSGILTGGGAEDNAILAPLAMAQNIAGLQGKLQSIDVSALTVPENELSRRAQASLSNLTSEEYDRWYCTAYVSTIAHQIEEVLPAASARPIWQVAASEGAVIGKIQVLLLTVSLAAIAAAAMAISSLMNTTVMERSREIGLMKALGAAEWEIQVLFLCEAAIVGLVGGAIGLLAGAALVQVVGQSVFGSHVDLRAVTVPIVLAISAVTVVLGAIMPARTIAALSPGKVLHGH